MSETVDYVVVGAGSAGCALAGRLSADPSVSVMLIEAGQWDTHPDIKIPFAAAQLLGSELDWNLRTVAQPGLEGRSVDWPRGRVVGGSSSLNFQMWVPGHAADFDDWQSVAGDDWSWTAVRPVLRRIERWAGEHTTGFGSQGPLWISPPRDPDPSTYRFLDACAAVGMKPMPDGAAGPDNTGFAMTPLTQHLGERWSSADGYLHPVRERPNLRVLVGQQVRRVLFDRQRRAVGVQLTDRTVTALREVVLAAGAVGSPHLLLCSGIGDPDLLRRSGVPVVVPLPGVGRNLQDHLLVDVSVRSGTPGRFLDAASSSVRQEYELARTGPLTCNVGEAVAFCRTDGGDGPADVEFIWAPMAYAEDGNVTAGFTIGVVLLRPESRGTLTLAGPDPASPPLIDPGYLTMRADTATLVRGVRLAEQVLAAEPLRSVTDGVLSALPSGDAGMERFIRRHAQTVYHPVGTCRIGSSDDQEAVVDEALRVRGVEGLRVVDVSVAPTLPRGHTHALAVLIAERGADFLLADARE